MPGKLPGKEQGEIQLTSCPKTHAYLSNIFVDFVCGSDVGPGAPPLGRLCTSMAVMKDKAPHHMTEKFIEDCAGLAERPLSR